MSQLELMANRGQHFTTSAYSSRLHVLRQLNCAISVCIILQCCEEVNCDCRPRRDGTAWRAPEPPNPVLVILQIHVYVFTGFEATSYREPLPAAVKDGNDIASLYATEKP